MSKMTIVDYLIKRINDLGISDIFGVPGDYNFNILEAINANPNTNWVGCCNELNSGYAADGYARIKEFGALVTTYGVGELSAINAVAGSFAENVPVIKIVGLPKKKIINNRKIVHHCLGQRDYHTFADVYSKVTEHNVILSLDNAQEEIEKALSILYHERRPVYIGLYDDCCTQEIKITTEEFKPAQSDESNLNAAINHICSIVEKSSNTIILSDFPVLRHGLQEDMQNLVDRSGLMATTMAMGKSSIDENSPNYIGIYCGSLVSDEIAHTVESADCILGFGILMTDFNSGGNTSKLDFDKVIDIQPHSVRIKDAEYQNVNMKDVLQKLSERISKTDLTIKKSEYGYKSEEVSDEQLTQNYIYSTIQDFLSSGDVYMPETGLTSFGSVPVKLPTNTKYCTQVLWGSIGWATPACFGASMADKTKRVIMVTGEGSHQMTAQEVSSMIRYGVNPIIVVINNDGYTIERLLCKNPMDNFNDIAQWDYTKFVESFNGEALTIKANTKKDFLEALNSARRSEKLVYIEAFTPMMDAPDFAKRLSEKVSPLESQAL
jgi:indolepyruvate decarboxylase